MAQLAVALNINQALPGNDYDTDLVGAPTSAAASSATVVTDLATVLTAYDAIGAAIVAISGDAYSATTHQFTNSGSTGLTSAQLHTQLIALNSMISSFLTAQTDAAAAHSGVSGADAILLLDGSKFTHKNQVWVAVRRLMDQAAGLVSL